MTNAVSINFKICQSDLGQIWKNVLCLMHSYLSFAAHFGQMPLSM